MLTANSAGTRQGQNPNNTSKHSICWYRTLSHHDNYPELSRLIYKPVKQTQAYLHIILLDTSGSMLSKQGLSQAKGILQYFCDRLYLQRDLLSLITFGNQQVNVVLDAKPAPKSANTLLDTITGGGGTPLAQALQKVAELSLKHKSHSQSLLIVTDGRVQETTSLPNFNIPITCIDMENEAVKLGKVKKLALQLGGSYQHIDQLQYFN